MKIKILMLSVFALLVMSACSKEKKYIKQINGTWKMDSYRVNGNDETTNFKNVFTNYTINFGENKSFQENWVTIIPLSKSGNYEFLDNASIIEMRDPNETRRFKINTIEKSKIDVEYTYSGSNNTSEVRRHVLIPV